LKAAASYSRPPRHVNQEITLHSTRMVPAHLIQLLDEHAAWRPLSLCPPMHAWHAADELPLWQALETAKGAAVPPPMFGLCWPGSQALARVILDGLVPVAGRTLLDVGCGSGVTAAAAALKGAHAVAADIDPSAVTSAAELARRHQVRVEALLTNPLEDQGLIQRVQIIVGGDLFYSQDSAAQGAAAVARWLQQDKTVVLADAGRPFFNPAGLKVIWEGDVEVPRRVEGVSTRRCRVWSGNL